MFIIWNYLLDMEILWKSPSFILSLFFAPLRLTMVIDLCFGIPTVLYYFLIAVLKPTLHFFLIVLLLNFPYITQLDCAIYLLMQTWLKPAEGFRW